jgi:hypothetical protein
MIETAKEALAKYGIVLTFTDSGSPELTSRRGVRCVYSDRNFTPVVGMDADGRFEVGRVEGGKAQLKVDGQLIDFGLRDMAFRTAWNDGDHNFSTT